MWHQTYSSCLNVEFLNHISHEGGNFLEVDVPDASGFVDNEDNIGIGSIATCGNKQTPIKISAASSQQRNHISCFLTFGSFSVSSGDGFSLVHSKKVSVSWAVKSVT